MFDMDKPVLILTEKAANQVLKLMEKKAEDSVVGLRVGVGTTGCSGLSYKIEYAHKARDYEEKIESRGVPIFIDPAAIMFLIGAEMDYETSTFKSGFVFTNPNETGRCGCGESFTVN